MTVTERYNLMQALNDIVAVDKHSLYFKTKESAEILSDLYQDATMNNAGVMYGATNVHHLDLENVYIVNKY